MAVSRLGLIGVGRSRYLGFQAKTTYQGKTRLGLIGVPAERYRTEQQITGSGAVTATTATASGSGVEGAITRLGLIGVPREDYKGFIGKTPLSTATVTGTGTPTAVTATASGAGALALVGAGTPQAVTATASGAGDRVITADGSRRGWVFPLTRQWFNQYWWIDAPKASRATAGVGSVSTRSGSGSPQATTATATSAGTRIITGTGTVQATTATSAGNVITENVVAGSGAVQADTATVSYGGTVTSNLTGTGAVAATTATASGVAGKSIFGSGVPQAQTATTSVSGQLFGTWLDDTGTNYIWNDLRSVAGISSSVTFDYSDQLGSETLRSIWFSEEQDLWVVVGDNGYIATRPAGDTTWTQQTIGISFSLRTVKFWNGKWYVCGYNRTVLESTDGMVWTSVLAPQVFSYMVTMTFSDDYLMIGGWSFDGRAYPQMIQIDTAGNVSTFTTSSSGWRWIYGLTYHPTDGFVIVGEDLGNIPFIARHPNSALQADKIVFNDATDFSTSIWSIDWNGTYYVAGTGLGRVKYTDDLDNWNNSTALELISDNVWRVTNDGNGNVVICGGFWVGKVMYSTDYGVTFDLAYSTDQAYLMSKAHYGNSRWVAVGWNGYVVEGLPNWQAESLPSTTWTTVSYS